MSDFLTNLAARSAGVAETIQPRVPALFEPQGPGGRLPASPGSGESEHETAEERDVPDVRPSSIEDPVTRVRPVRQTAEEEPRPQAAAVGDANRPPSPLLADRRDVPAVNVGTPKTAAVPPVELVAPASLASPRPSVGEAPVKAPAAEPIERTALFKPREPERTPVSPSAGKEPAIPPAASRNEPAPPPAAPPLRPAKTIAQPQVMPRVEKPRPTPAPTSTKTPEPVIHVTIGRIEVRASSEAATSRKAPATRPVTSLDEYLSGRAKRGTA